MGQKPVLGKGLASLFPGAVPVAQTAPVAEASVPDGATLAGTPMIAPAATEFSNRDRHPGISIALVDEIIANTYQPRREFDDNALQELAQSIRANGVIQPLIVRKGSRGYELIAGERRLRAAKLAGLKHVPIVIRKSTDRESLELALIENIQRQDLNCMDEALAYFQLLEEFQLTQEQVAERVGKDRATVANYLRLLRLPQVVIEDLKGQVLSFGHGKALLGLDDNELCLKARSIIIENKLSVRATEALCDEIKTNAAAAAQTSETNTEAVPLTPVQSRLSSAALDLSRQWSTKIEIKGSERRGKIVLHYSSRQDLDRILHGMQNSGVWAEQQT